MQETHDVVIVGAGAAGCVLASRLTEDAGTRVLLMEAGPDYGPDRAAWPYPMLDPTSGFTESDGWGYTQAGRSADRPLPLPRGRVVGGSSAINSCTWLRGSAADYDGWAAHGNPGWSFADLLPFFRRAETDPVGGPLHGSDGPVLISRVPPESLTTVDRAVVGAAELLGLSTVADLNGTAEQDPCVGPTPKNVEADVRLSGAFTYIHPARSRSNLTLMPNTLVDRVLVEGGSARGIRSADGRQFVGREVVLCAGAYGSPAILLRSGIGPASHLNEHGIPVILDLPGVGEHLLDHPFLGSVLEYAIEPEFVPDRLSFGPVMIKARSNQVADEIDLHIYEVQWLDDSAGRWIFALSVSLQRARSRGRVRLTAADPLATLEIDHAHLSDPTDLEALCDGVEFAARLTASSPLAAMVTMLPGRTLTWRDRDELRACVRERVGTTFHPSSTCRMGPATDPTAVVDHQGRVHGVAGLRVIDASIFPTGPRCNLHFPVVAIAEKLASVMRDTDMP